MTDEYPAVSPSNAASTNVKCELFDFVHLIERSFKVSVSRLSSLASRSKIDFGGLFITSAVRVFWESKMRTPGCQFEELDAHLTTWITMLVDVLLEEILQTSLDESTALRQLLMMGLPPYADDLPTVPSTDRFITSIAAIQSFADIEREQMAEFMEQYPCLVPVPLFLILRDCTVMLILQSSKENCIYNCRTRQVLFRLSEAFSLDPDVVRMVERSIGEILHGHEIVDDSRAIVSQSTRNSQKLKIGLGALGGAVLLGVTGGLAFPVLASVASGVGAALTGVGLGVVGTVFATTSLFLGSISVGGAVALFGITGGSLMTYKLSNRFGNLNIHDFKFKRLSRISEAQDQAHDALEIVLCVSGYLRTQRDYVEPWKVIRRRNANLSDPYALQWERTHLAALGSVFVKLLSNELASALTSIYINASLGVVSTTATLPISVLSVMADSDNILHVCENRARQVGEALAEVICNQDFGARPFTLIAYSIGATAVFTCLAVLADKGQFSRVQNVVLLGSTIPCSFILEGQRTPWQKARSVVSGRFVNVFSKKDVLLHFLCRYVQWSIQVAGVSEVREEGIENFDASEIIAAHSDYPANIGLILTRIGYLS
jgi:hypothetical protein